MRNRIRVVLICSVLIGGTAFLGHQTFNQFNTALDNMSASYLALANTPTISLAERARREAMASTTEELISSSASSTAAIISFAFPKKGSEVYVGCTYRVLLAASTTVDSIGVSLVDVGTDEAAGPIASGLQKDISVAASTQSFDWKIGAVWPGNYAIDVSKVNDLDVKAQSESFVISKMSEEIKASDRVRLCKESGGLLKS